MSSTVCRTSRLAQLLEYSDGSMRTRDRRVERNYVDLDQYPSRMVMFHLGFAEKLRDRFTHTMKRK
jgi:hypothetical protein